MVSDEVKKPNVTIDDAENDSAYAKPKEYVERMNSVSGVALADYNVDVHSEDTDIDHGGG